MMIRRIAGATRNLGAPKDWDPERDGLCSVLPIRDVVGPDGPAMLSAWEPTPEELEAVSMRGLIQLRVVGAVLLGMALLAACDGEAWEACSVVDMAVVGGGASLLVTWQTTPAVVRLLAAGHSLYLRIPGTAHPPVMVWVEVAA
jgi:hypothetical protein